MEKIDLNEYRRTGEGANGASYDSISDPTVMVKMYNPNYPTGPVEDELAVARKVYELGIPSPEPGVLVTDGERIGIRFKRIKNKRSFSRMLADEPERVVEFAKEFTVYFKELHSRTCGKDQFPDAKEQFLFFLDTDKNFTPDQKKAIADFIRSVPDSGTCLHGDMHIGNILSTLPKGRPMSDPHEVLFIDLGYFSRGCPLFDIGMLQQVCIYADEDFRQHDFHIDGKLSKKFWDVFVDEYFFAEDRLAEKYFGPGQTPESVEVKLRPYMCSKYLFMSYVMGFLPEPLIDIVRKTFSI